MKDNRRPNYGLDAPLAVRNLLIVAALGIISLITRLLHVWSRQDLIAVIARPLISAGLSCGAMAVWITLPNTHCWHLTDSKESSFGSATRQRHQSTASTPRFSANTRRPSSSIEADG